MMVAGGWVASTPLCTVQLKQVALDRLPPDARIDCESGPKGVRVEAYAANQLVWAGRIDSRDCALVAEVVDIQLSRATAEPASSVPLGELPSLRLAEPNPPAEPAAPALAAASRWGLELGLGGGWEVGGPSGGRFTGTLDAAVRYRGWGLRAEFGGALTRRDDVTGPAGRLGETRLGTTHFVLMAERCPMLRLEPLRICALIGGGAEIVWADASGDGVFQLERPNQRRGRGDAGVAIGWGRRPGIEVLLRGTFRPDAPRLEVEDALTEARLPEWAAGIGLRGFLGIF
jgi:hypothetical protein